jgi:hypothetical protein
MVVESEAIEIQFSLSRLVLFGSNVLAYLEVHLAHWCVYSVVKKMKGARLPFILARAHNHFLARVTHEAFSAPTLRTHSTMNVIRHSCHQVQGFVSSSRCKMNIFQSGSQVHESINQPNSNSKHVGPQFARYPDLVGHGRDGNAVQNIDACWSIRKERLEIVLLGHKARRDIDP